jgi:hypothetical protein
MSWSGPDAAAVTLGWPEPVADAVISTRLVATMPEYSVTTIPSARASGCVTVIVSPGARALWTCALNIATRTPDPERSTSLV